MVRQKLEEYGVEVLGNTICNDEPDMVTEAVNDWIKKGAQMVVCTGGMSVDPDDKTPLAIRNASDEVITYGARFCLVRCLCWPIKVRFRSWACRAA